MLHGLLYVIELTVGVGLLVFVHELGHFLAAKWFRIKVDVFSLGFGPRLVGLQRGGTDYRLSLVPVGGYVAMPGEDPKDCQSQDPTHFHNHPPSHRLVVLVAGVTMNMVFSLVLFTLIYWWGMETIQPLVGQVRPGSPAQTAGIRRGDRIESVNGNRDIDFSDVALTVAMTGAGEKVDLTLSRDGGEYAVSVEPGVDPDLGHPTIGVEWATGTTVTEVEENGPGARAGLVAGDRIVNLDGEPVFDGRDIADYVWTRPGKDITVTVIRDGSERVVTLRPEAVRSVDLGVGPKEPLTVDAVVAGSPAEKAGVEAGDKLVEVAGVPISDPAQAIQIISTQPGRELRYLIERNGARKTFRIAAERAPHTLTARIGVVWREREPVVGAVDPDSPLAKAGMKPGDRITRFGTRAIKSWGDISAATAALTFPVTANVEWSSGEVQHGARVEFQSLHTPWFGEARVTLEPAQTQIKRYPVHVVPWVGLKKTVQGTQQVYLTLRGLLTRRVAASHASGPVGIVSFAYRAAEAGPTKLMYFLAIIGVNLAVFNLLPFPVLDGGHIVFVLAEKIRGKRLDPRMMEILAYVGWGTILLIFLLVTYNDIRRFFTGGP